MRRPNGEAQSHWFFKIMPLKVLRYVSTVSKRICLDSRETIRKRSRQ